MPYRSKAQRNYFHANRAKLEAQGVDVESWDRETGNRPLPDRAGKDETHKPKDNPSRANVPPS
jgi:hypothetical protein